jgi:lipid A disaccharide synthetase
MRTLAAKVTQRGEAVVVLAPNAEVAEALHTKCVGLEVRNLAENPQAFADVRAAVCGPGTASLELALRAIPTTVVGRVDLFTYVMGRALLKVPHFALPNLLANERWIPEHLVPAFPWGPRDKIVCAWAKEWNLQSPENAKARSTSLRAMLAGPSLCGEFAQFIQRNK